MKGEGRTRWRGLENERGGENAVGRWRGLENGRRGGGSVHRREGVVEGRER